MSADVRHSVSNLLLDKQLLLCALYGLDADGETPATTDAILERHAEYARLTPGPALSNDLLSEYVDHLQTLDLIVATDHDPTRYDLALDADTLRDALEDSPRFQLIKALSQHNLF
jgi:hypothetical protein